MGIVSAPTPVKSEAPSRDYNKVDAEKEKFDSVIKKASKKLDKVDSGIKKKESHVIKNKKIDLEETHLPLDPSLQEGMIMNLLADYLQIPKEEIQQVLKNLEMEPTALIDKENFGKFVSELYGEPLEELLLSNSNIKSISVLWEKLEKIGELFNNDFAGEMLNADEQVDEQIDDNKIINKQISSEQAAGIEKPNGPIDDNLQNMQAINTLSRSESPEIVSLPTLLGGEEVKKDIKVSENVEQITVSEGEHSIRLGLQVPIEAFNSSSGAKMWDQVSKEQAFSKLGSHAPVENQILTKIQVVPLSQGKEIHMDLAPKDLGKISFKLVEENGVLTAQIRVENEKTKELVLQSIDTLKEGLKEQGLMIGDFTVDVRDQSRQSQMHQGRQKSSKRIEEIIAKHLDIIEEEQVEESQTTGSELDIMA